MDAGPSLTPVRPMAGAGASASAAVSNGRATADPTNPIQSRGITSRMCLRLTTETANLEEMHETWHSCTYAFRYVASLDRPIHESPGFSPLLRFEFQNSRALLP